ncbi:hypothetical protein BH23ACT9_BH23ACT9_22590 [soil metagenome]
MRRPRHLAILLALALCLGITPVAAGDDPGGTIVKTANVTEVAQHRYTGGTEIAFDGDFVYAAQFNGVDNRNQLPDQGGVFIFYIGDGGFDLVGKIDCSGTDTYPVVVEPGLLAVGHHSSDCNPVADRVNSRGRNNGFYLVDVSGIDPEAPFEDNLIQRDDPRIIGGIGVRDAAGGFSSHTITTHPTKPYIYIQPGGLANGDSSTRIVNISDPTEPRLASTFRNNEAGCHDLQFLIAEDGDFAFCAGLGEVQTWDISDVEKPVVVGSITNPGIQFPHNALPSPDGTLLVINDEAFAAHECQSQTSIFGSLWVYDITDRANPALVSRVAPPVGASVVGYSGMDLAGVDGRPFGTASGWTRSWCAAHNYNFVPGTNTLVAGWFNGGVTVEDLSNPTSPQRIASYRAAPSIVYTAHFHQASPDAPGRIYVNDLNRGMEVLEVAGLRTQELPEVVPAPAPSGLADRSAQLIPPVLPPRPVRLTPSLTNSAFCVIPAI